MKLSTPSIAISASVIVTGACLIANSRQDSPAESNTKIRLDEAGFLYPASHVRELGSRRPTCGSDQMRVATGTARFGLFPIASISPEKMSDLEENGFILGVESLCIDNKYIMRN